MKNRGILTVGFLIGAAVLVWFDQWTKQLAKLYLENQPPKVLLDSIFELQYLENRGAAFGMLQGKQFFFLVIAAVVLCASALLLARVPLTRRFLPLTGCAMLICSGAIGNMIDRVSRGYVVDFFYFKLINFPIFNVADCYVTVAAFLLIALIFFYYKEEELSWFTLKKGAGK